LNHVVILSQVRYEEAMPRDLDADEVGSQDSGAGRAAIDLPGSRGGGNRSSEGFAGMYGQ